MKKKSENAQEPDVFPFYSVYFDCAKEPLHFRSMDALLDACAVHLAKGEPCEIFPEAMVFSDRSGAQMSNDT